MITDERIELIQDYLIEKKKYDDYDRMDDFGEITITVPHHRVKSEELKEVVDDSSWIDVAYIIIEKTTDYKPIWVDSEIKYEEFSNDIIIYYSLIYERGIA